MKKLQIFFGFAFAGLIIGFGFISQYYQSDMYINGKLVNNQNVELIQSGIKEGRIDIKNVNYYLIGDKKYLVNNWDNTLISFLLYTLLPPAIILTPLYLKAIR